MPHPWAQLAYPDFCGINASLGFGLGPSFYAINSLPRTDENFIDSHFAALTLGLTQVLGYNSWFYLQLKEDFSYGFASSGREIGGDPTTYVWPRRIFKSLFFDASAKLFVPLLISHTNRISLQPLVGFEVHQVYVSGRLRTDTPKGTLLRQRFLALLAGLALG